MIRDADRRAFNRLEFSWYRLRRRTLATSIAPRSKVNSLGETFTHREPTKVDSKADAQQVREWLECLDSYDAVGR